MFFFFYGIIIGKFCAAARLIACRSFYIFLFGRDIILVTIKHAEAAFINHFMIALDICSPSGIYHMFRKICVVIEFQKVVDVIIVDIGKFCADINPYNAVVFLF